MLRILRLRLDDLVAERSPGSEQDVHFPLSLARAVVDEYSSVGDVVLDPFAGWGTTLVAAEQLGRSAVGIELLAERSAVIRERVSDAAVLHTADARELPLLDLGPIDLCLTSPPYMPDTGHPQNPLTAYTSDDGDYRTYLDELTGVFAAVGERLRPGGHLVINAANIHRDGGVTTLAWDIARRVAEHVPFVGETWLEWDVPPPAFSGDYLLTFRAS